ncbi:MAG TPA: gliding motility-associated C-terminal domain-containing protein [Saprospiraceae bacterium]|nr:gliding motility-associated C-terminal domain-containing protein [Saprospiraceae bacterium]HMP13988.1 gliding motility-associated C-terminal domain-containing protein [Saprospiraceae bacterium]
MNKTLLSCALWLVIIWNCGATDSLRIEASGARCVDSALLFRAVANFPIQRVEWDFDNGQTTANTAPSLRFSRADTYVITLVATDSSGRTHAALLSLTIDNCPPCGGDTFVMLTPEGALCRDSTIQWRFPDSLQLTRITWFLPDGSSTQDSVATLLLTTPGSYTLSAEAFSAAGCRYISVALLEVEDCTRPEDCSVQFPTAFTPNQDGRNDTFRLLSNCTLRNFQLRIFNRWGQLVFESNDPAAAWNGMFNNQPAPADAYAWIARYRLPNSDLFITKKGEVMILR